MVKGKPYITATPRFKVAGIAGESSYMLNTEVTSFWWFRL